MTALVDLMPAQGELFEDSFDLTDVEMRFVHEYLANGEDGQAAYLAVVPDSSPSNAKSQASRWLNGRGRKSSEVRRYLRHRRLHAVMRQRLTEDELIQGARRVYLHGVGDLPLRKDIVLKDGSLKRRSIHDPNLSAANTAIETLRKIGGFGADKGEGLAPDEDGKRFSPTERAARVAALLERRKQAERAGATDADDQP